MNQVVALAVKDVRLLLRDKTGFFFTFFFPLLYCIFFGIVFSQFGRTGGGSKIRLAIVDQDQTAESKEFIEDLREGPELEVSTASREEAEELVRKGQRMAFLVLPQGFGEARDRFIWQAGPELELGIDPSRQAEAGLLQGLLTKTMFLGMQDMFSNPAKMSERVKTWTAQIERDQEMDAASRAALLFFLPALESFTKMMSRGEAATEDAAGGSDQSTWNPVPMKTVSIMRQRRGPTNSYAITFPQGIIWGVMGCAAAFGISLVQERTGGTLIRLRTAPIRPAHILAGKAGACGFTTVLLCVLLLLIARFVFKVEPHSLSMLALAIGSIAICFVGVMMLLTVLGRTEQSAGGIGWAVLLVMAMIGGGMVPLMFLPPFMVKLAHISPVKWSILAMEGAIWRGFSPSEMLTPCGILIAIGVVCFVIGTRAFKWSAAN